MSKTLTALITVSDNRKASEGRLLSKNSVGAVVRVLAQAATTNDFCTKALVALDKLGLKIVAIEEIKVVKKKTDYISDRITNIDISNGGQSDMVTFFEFNNYMLDDEK